MNLRVSALMVLAAALSGCTGAAGETYLGRPGSPAWFATASPQTIATHFRAQCEAYGFQPGTNEMAQCIQQAAEGRQGRNAARMNTVAAINAANMPRPTRQVQCRSTTFGSTTTTNCQ